MSGKDEEVKVIHRYSEGLKRKVVAEIEDGSLSVVEAMSYYGIGHRRTVYRWMQKFGTNRRATQVVRVMMKSEQERIAELEKALAAAQLENCAMKGLVAVVEEEYGARIKKNSSIEQLKRLEDLKKKAGIV